MKFENPLLPFLFVFPQSLDSETDAQKIALQLASLCQNERISARPSGVEDSARFEQAFSFACGLVQESMRSGHPELSEIFEVSLAALNSISSFLTFLL